MDALKAAFVFNFAKFTSWPPDKAPEDRVRFCFEDGAIDPSAYAEWHDKVVQGAPVETKVIASDFAEADIDDCHIAFISSHLSADARSFLLDKAARGNVLMVSDTEGFAQSGGHINLLRAGSRIRFEVNLDAVRHAGLTLSSRLLNLAEITGE